MKFDPVYRCRKCGHLYMEKVTACDCLDDSEEPQLWDEGIAIFGVDEWSPTRFSYKGKDKAGLGITVEDVGSGKYAVRDGGGCLNKKLEWEYEPLPSSRSVAFLRRTRLASVEDATARVANWLKRLKR